MEPGTRRRAGARSSGAVTEVLMGSARVDGGVVRLIVLADGSGRLERWPGAQYAASGGEAGWVPGGAAVAELFFAPPASAELLVAPGVPPDDWP